MKTNEKMARTPYLTNQNEKDNMSQITKKMRIRHYTKLMVRIFLILGGFYLMIAYYMGKDTVEFDNIPLEQNATEYEPMENVESNGNDKVTYPDETICLANYDYASTIQIFSGPVLNAETVFGVRRNGFTVESQAYNNRLDRFDLSENTSLIFTNDIVNQGDGFLSQNQSYGYNGGIVCSCAYCNSVLQSKIIQSNLTEEI